MTPFQLLLALKARVAIVLGVIILTLLAAWASYQMLPRTYKSTATIIMNYKGTDPITGSSVPGQSTAGYMPTYVSTQIDIIKSISVALRVVDQLQLQNLSYFREVHLKQATAVPIRDWLGGFLLSHLQVNPSKESSVLTISYRAMQPEVAAAIANGFVQAYLSTSAELTASPAKDASTYFTAQLRQLRTSLEQAQSKVSQYQQRHGIVNIDNKVDVENSRLNELSRQLAIAQSQTAEAAARRDYATKAAANSPDVANSPVTQALELELSKARMQMGEISNRFAPDHPSYIGAQANVERAETLLRRHMNAVSRSVGNNAGIFAQRQSELQGALDEQRAKVLDLNSKRDELSLLLNDLETIRHNYTTVSQRLAQTRIQGQSSQADVAVLASADAARAVSSPPFSLTMAVAALLGLSLGVVAALAVEWFDRRVRSLQELERLIGVPVLALIDSRTPLNGSARRALRYSPFLLPKA
ncbi:MAG: Chain length determinant protein EpsF [Herminiimonas sp.]|nr:Chain length determinant protein EpsF [Herminiimonas sp.]